MLRVFKVNNAGPFFYLPQSFAIGQNTGNGFIALISELNKTLQMSIFNRDI